MEPKRRRTMRDFESSIEKQIREAQDRGEFDDLPGLGKPIPGLDRPHDELWWLKGLLQREGLSFLPGTLELRRDVEQALLRVRRAPDEATVRRLVRELNETIVTTNRTVTSGPPSDISPFDVDDVIAQWRGEKS